MKEGKGAFKILTGEPTWRLGWEDNVIVDFKEMGALMRNRIDLAQVRDYWKYLWMQN